MQLHDNMNFFADKYRDVLNLNDRLDYASYDTEDFSVENHAATHEVSHLSGSLSPTENSWGEDFLLLNPAVVQKILDEIPEEILSSTENLLGTMEEPDQVFHENFMNLTTMSAESNMNSFHTETTIDNMVLEPNTGTLERINRFGIVMGTTNSDALSNCSPCNIKQFDTAAEGLGPRPTCIAGHSTMESSLQNNAISPLSQAYECTHAVVPEISHPLVIVNPNSRKRPVEEDTDPGQAVVLASKKRIEEPCSDVASFVNEKTIPAGEASSEGKERRPVATTWCRTCVREPAEEAALNEQKNEVAIEYLKSWVKILFEENESLSKDRETHKGDISKKKNKSSSQLQKMENELERENAELRTMVKTMSSEVKSLRKRLHISSEVSVITTKNN
ncbi:uncharacterized protein LOC114536157 isoform X1 [Dendronephthya gigantea]|uniref:uncharacterized protein LOC114536157 isoform X1 n=1 Tax=Dendronephthya gigantea TaxID=151771 RepID=UPI00106A665B|nr:uncharacterized protein LOC114536157 isoform X1 [Dendronephthya gigantea]XP_028413308.1 uncharacterized protein LOC114536157 isoform X1 [Dendronephthya gigantea]